MSCDTKAAAEAAGVSESTVHLHRRTDPAFAEAYAEALRQGYFFLEAEAVRLRLEAQKRLRAAIEAGADNPPLHLQGRGTAEGGGGALAGSTPCPHCGRTDDPDAEFDRVMKLLARHDRKPPRPERGFRPGGRRQPWTFDRAIALLVKKLKAMGVKLPELPPRAIENLANRGDYPEYYREGEEGEED